MTSRPTVHSVHIQTAVWQSAAARPAFPAPPYLFFLAGSGPLDHMHSMVVCVVTRETPELVVLVDFKAIYPGGPPGIFASFPGVAHFLSFEQICQYPRVSLDPRGKFKID